LGNNPSSFDPIIPLDYNFNSALFSPAKSGNGGIVLFAAFLLTHIVTELASLIGRQPDSNLSFYAISIAYKITKQSRKRSPG
jgi:hypothetical protein